MSDDSPSRNFQNDEQIIFLPSHKIARGKVSSFRQLLKPAPAMHILNVGASGPNFAFAGQFESLYEHRDQVTGGGISLSRSAGLPGVVFLA